MAFEPKTWACGDTITAEDLVNIERGVVEVNSEYVPNEWVCGDVISADKLNHIEQGIANASGGGGEDNGLSFAEVTVVNETDDWLELSSIPVAYEADGMGEGSPACISPYLEVGPESQHTYKVPMYKGVMYIMGVGDVNGDGVNVVVYGSSLMITGDGTLTALQSN